MHPGIYGSVDVVEYKGHHYTTPENNVVDNSLWREGEQGERQGAREEAGRRGGRRKEGRRREKGKNRGKNRGKSGRKSRDELRGRNVEEGGD